MGKEKKINVLITFFILHKSDVKTFLKLIVNQYSKSTCQFPKIKSPMLQRYRPKNYLKKEKSKLNGPFRLRKKERERVG